MSAGKVLLGLGAAGAIITGVSAQYDNPPGYSGVGFAERPGQGFLHMNDGYGNTQWPVSFDFNSTPATTPAATLAPHAVVLRAVRKLNAAKEPACPEKLPDYQYKINGKEPTRSICLDPTSFALNPDGSVNVSPSPNLSKEAPITINVPKTLNMPENTSECPKIQKIMIGYAGHLLHGEGLVPKGQEVKFVFVTDPKRPGLSQCDSRYVKPATKVS